MTVVMVEVIVTAVIIGFQCCILFVGQELTSALCLLSLILLKCFHLFTSQQAVIPVLSNVCDPLAAISGVETEM